MVKVDLKLKNARESYMGLEDFSKWKKLRDALKKYNIHLT